MTIETLMFLRQLVANQQLTVGAPDFLNVVDMLMKAIAELDIAIRQAQIPQDNIELES